MFLNVCSLRQLISPDLFSSARYRCRATFDIAEEIARDCEINLNGYII